LTLSVKLLYNIDVLTDDDIVSIDIEDMLKEKVKSFNDCDSLLFYFAGLFFSRSCVNEIILLLANLGIILG